MENKETERNPAELNDAALENVNGGLGAEMVTPFCCAECGTKLEGVKYTKNGKYYCDTCWAKLT